MATIIDIVYAQSHKHYIPSPNLKQQEVNFNFNARDLKSKLNTLDNCISNMSKLPSIIIITETWLDEYVVLPKFLSSCYSVIKRTGISMVVVS